MLHITRMYAIYDTVSCECNGRQKQRKLAGSGGTAPGRRLSDMVCDVRCNSEARSGFDSAQARRLQIPQAPHTSRRA